MSKQFLPPVRWARPLIRAASSRPVTVLRDVTVGVAAGEVVGLIGPNGAGKSTLMRIGTGLLEPSSGHVFHAGVDVTGNPSRAGSRVGLLLEGDRGLYGRLNGLQNLEFFGGMNGLNRTATRERARELTDPLGLIGLDKLVFSYSSGMRLRLSLARALLTNPPLLVLDEPTRSLDPVAGLAICNLLRQLADRGHAVFVSSHRVDEMVPVCDRVIGLASGQVRFDRDMDHTTAVEKVSSDLIARLNVTEDQGSR